jgi:hypothetical protein
MKTRNPLAAALLLLASSAPAQLLNPGASFGTSSQSPFSLSGASASDDDMVFKCSTPPYIACTTAQMNRRELVRETRVCPSPVSKACTDYLESAAGRPLSTGPIQLLGNSPDVKWASPDCTHIPCRLADSPASGLPYDRQPGFIGPPAPPQNNLPPAFDPKDFQKELAAARAESQNTIVDMGDNRYGVVLEDGTVSVCGSGLCSMPRPASEFPKLAEQIQAAVSLNSGGESLNNGNPNGFTASSNKQTPNLDNSGRTNAPEQAAANNNPSEEARSFGQQAASDSAAVSGTSAFGSAAGGSVASGGYASAATEDQVIKTKAASLGSIEITYSRLQKTEADIQGAAGAFKDGQMTGFASPNAPAASGRPEMPPVDEKYLGKIQAASNE